MCITKTVDTSGTNSLASTHRSPCVVDKRLDEWVDKSKFLNEAQMNKLKKQGRIPNNLPSSPDEFITNVAANPSEHTITRNTRRRLERFGSIRPLSPVSMDPAYEQLEREHEEATKVKNIQKIVLGRYEIDAWYFSPYPDEYAQGIDRLFICEKCLKYMKDEESYPTHYYQCNYTGPPGKCIYLKDNLAIFELDGEATKLYCQNLCLIAKLFLDHKTLYYDVSPFYFYVLCEVDGEGVHPVGYFSKEKASPDDYNLACIMILPPYQKKGYGRFLIQLSYEITRREGKTGSPEKPLSDLGKLSYSSFWAYELLIRLRNASSRSIPTITELSKQTGFKSEDITETLTELGLMRQYRGQKVLNLAPKVLDTLLKDFEGKRMTKLDPECLDWP